MLIPTLGYLLCENSQSIEIRVRQAAVTASSNKPSFIPAASKMPLRLCPSSRVTFAFGPELTECLAMYQISRCELAGNREPALASLHLNADDLSFCRQRQPFGVHLEWRQKQFQGEMCTFRRS